MNQTTYPTETLTYQENGHTYNIVCAFCIAEWNGRQQGAVTLILTSKGRYPACADHAAKH